jgi:FkbM family methyltransferase
MEALEADNGQGKFKMPIKKAQQDRSLRPRRYARTLLSHLPPGLALPILSGPLRGRAWLVRSANFSCWLGSYEQIKLRAFAAELRRGAVVFDIGAHVGFYSLLSAVLAGPSGRVFAFEPLASNVANLRRHAALNRVSVEVIEAAVADRDGEALFQRGADSYTGGLDDQGTPVAVVTMDGLRAAGRLPAPDLVKIDVEGAESLVLKGASKTILTARPTIFLATHGTTSRAHCLDLLDGFGYVTEPLVGDGLEPETEFVARPLPRRHSGVGSAHLR